MTLTTHWLAPTLWGSVPMTQHIRHVLDSPCRHVHLDEQMVAEALRVAPETVQRLQKHALIQMAQRGEIARAGLCEADGRYSLVLHSVRDRSHIEANLRRLKKIAMRCRDMLKARLVEIDSRGRQEKGTQERLAAIEYVACQLRLRSDLVDRLIELPWNRVGATSAVLEHLTVDLLEDATEAS